LPAPCGRGHGHGPRASGAPGDLDGRYDDLPVQAFYFSGDMTEIGSNIGRKLAFGPVTPGAQG
jgi:hypothetical protein